MKNKKVIASFKCVLAMLSCLMLGACRPQMAKAVVKVAEKTFSRNGSKAEAFLQRTAGKGIRMPSMSGGELRGARNLAERPGVMSQGCYQSVGRAIYHVSQQGGGRDENDQVNRYYYNQGYYNR